MKYYLNKYCISERIFYERELRPVNKSSAFYVEFSLVQSQLSAYSSQTSSRQTNYSLVRGAIDVRRTFLRCLSISSINQHIANVPSVRFTCDLPRRKFNVATFTRSIRVTYVSE